MMLGDPLTEDRGFILHILRRHVRLQHSCLRQYRDYHLPRCAGNVGTQQQLLPMYWSRWAAPHGIKASEQDA
ncbi:hypothetical protein KCP76_05375 [Salmonella enterica subsp. enterica serovar Weltevreden]|nr:hypothetical protein KCP76_05375 [Salmonella enterica subsp. enterica serovar Weltevreden]